MAWTTIELDVDPSILSKNELALYQSFTSSERKQEFLVGRHIAKKIAADIGLKAEDLTIDKDEEGKPVANYQGRQYFISISHSDEQVMCAFSSDLSIGIDIEPTGRQITTELRKRIMSENEVTTLQGVNTLRIWTMKEALLKLYGKKLGSSLKECLINHSDTDIYEGEVSGHIKAQIFSEQYDNYWMAVAW